MAVDPRISTLHLFCRVARLGSFTAAAKELGLSQPSVSRIVSKLEADLGATLFVRSTHALRLTEAGAAYLERVEPLLASLTEAIERADLTAAEELLAEVARSSRQHGCRTITRAAETALARRSGR